MITTLIAAATCLAPARVAETIDPSSPVVSAQVMVPVPELGARGQAIVRTLAESILEGTDVYGRADFRNLAARAGDVVRCTAMPDHLSISMTVLPGDTKQAISMLHSLARRAALPAEAVSQAEENLTLRHAGFWEAALRPEKLAYRRIPRAEVVEMYQRLFRPETVTLAVGGPIQPGDAETAWSALTADWTPPRLRPAPPDPAPTFSDRIDGPVSVIELRGKTIVGGDVALPSRLLALVGLSSGKGASLFRVVREKLSWSYLQDGLLWPVPGGFQPRLMVAQTTADGLETRAEQMRNELLEDVKSWTEADLARARGMADAIFRRGLNVNPLVLRNPFGPLTARIEDRTFMSGYWFMKTSSEWDPETLLATLGKVSLDDLKQTATDLLASATPRVYRGR